MKTGMQFLNSEKWFEYRLVKHEFGKKPPYLAFLDNWLGLGSFEFYKKNGYSLKY